MEETMRSRMRLGSIFLLVSPIVLLGGGQQSGTAPEGPAASAALTPQQTLLKRYCFGCHNERLKSGGLALDALDVTQVGKNPEEWEKVVTKLRAGLMPPARMPRPDEKTYDGFRLWLQDRLDQVAATHPNPGRTEIFHRLNRTEYQNAIRDLLALEIKTADLLPADDASNGFDNMAGTLRMSQSLMERYLSAAKAISRMAVGSPLPAVDSKMYRLPPDLQQYDRGEGLPFGTRGGILIKHLFPRDADYDVKVELAGARRLYDEQKLEISIDGEQAKLFTFEPTKKDSDRVSPYDVDGKVTMRVHVGGGPHDVGVTFYRKPADLVEQVREPFPNPRISGNDGGPGGPQPDVAGVTILGPYNDKGPGETPSRRRIFVCYPSNPSEEPSCAKTILSKLAYRAYRGPARDESLRVLLDFYNDGRKDGGSFDTGIEFAIRRLLVSPEFLFRIEADPPAARMAPAAAGASFIYRLSDLELASRLSFFLWSSIPDEELLKAAQQGQLRDNSALETQVRRMLKDARSDMLTTNFAEQWLELRNVELKNPGDPYSLAYDQTLRRGLRRETELFVDSIIREDRPALEMLTARYTFLNQRVSEHYGIPNIIGTDFRRVDLDADNPRGGLLGQGSILTITSHPNRTSPVLRGKYILKEILGTPPPDPPPNVPTLNDQKTQAKVHTLREQMARHRANEPCATCHSMIDPAGFALENFDAIGRWRVVDESFNALDTSGALPDGTKFSGVKELKEALVKHPERFVNTVTEKLMTYALGRGLEYYDMPSVRKVVKDASADNYRMQAIILGIVKSYPFQMRRVDPTPNQHPDSVARSEVSKRRTVQ